MEGRVIQSPEAVKMGALGAHLITGTTDYQNQDVAIIYIVTDATFTTLRGNNLYKDGTSAVSATGWDGLVLVAGQTIFGRFTRIKLASGSVIAYQASPK